MINLQITNNFDKKVKLSDELIINIISSIIKNESNYDKASISIIISNDEYLRQLKIKYFDMDIFTDVITFDLSDNDRALEAEIYISWERVADNAKKYKEIIDKEAKRVIIHGCLHLVGFNDFTKEEKKQMRSKEKQYLDKLTKDVILEC